MHIAGTNVIFTMQPTTISTPVIEDNRNLSWVGDGEEVLQAGDAWETGGGVTIRNQARFNMLGGSIISHTIYFQGAGVLVNQGHFYMRGGTIDDNTSSGNSGGGVAVWGNNALFDLYDGYIQNNHALGAGYGGVQ